VGPHARQARQEILELRELDLHFRLGGLGPDGEDLQDQFSAVYNLAFQRPFKVSCLHGRELIVEDDDIDKTALDDMPHFLDLAFSEKPCGVFLFFFLNDARDDIGAGGIGQELEFVEILFDG